ncbi:MAG: NAD(P)(+) transhydrogenase (Re/Si-specific) subunit beta, partial [archaeon]
MDAAEIFYLLSAVLFIIGIKEMSSPRTARRGNLLSSVGMFVAIIVALLDMKVIGYTYIIIGIAIGTAAGVLMATRVKMPAMPQMVAALNGFGGGASALVSVAEFLQITGSMTMDVSITLILGLLVGIVTFVGSFVAFAKLEGIIKSAPIVLPFHNVVNLILMIAALFVGVTFVMEPSISKLAMIVVISMLLGVTSVISIGGADMPVVISLLNSYSGVAAAMTGFVISNSVLIITGALVGASGIILCNIMCKAMNRNLANVVFGRVGAELGATADSKETRKVTSYSPDDIVVMLENANAVIIVPGYGLAVAQAQQVLNEVAVLLGKRGVKVRYAIHPVAGRMPGHMNVLLSEANVPYDQLYEMESINSDFAQTDVALMVGANDVVNPAARSKKGSPLYGMPILNADQAKTAIVLKRSLRPGFAGEDNEIFYSEKTMMLFGDAKESLTSIARIL